MRLGFVMTCYDDADVVVEAIADVLRQTRRCELVVVDNGSTDGSYENIRAFDVASIHLPRNEHHGKALNLGAAHLLTNGCDWIVVQNSDDRCDPEYAQAIVDTATEHPDVNCIFSPWADMKGCETVRFPAYHPVLTCYQHQIPGIRAVRRDLWECTRGEDANIPIGSDWDWAARASVEGWLRPWQLERPYVRLRERSAGRPSLSSHVNWPKLNTHMKRHRRGEWATWDKAA